MSSPFTGQPVLYTNTSVRPVLDFKVPYNYGAAFQNCESSSSAVLATGSKAWDLEVEEVLDMHSVVLEYTPQRIIGQMAPVLNVFAAIGDDFNFGFLQSPGLWYRDIGYGYSVLPKPERFAPVAEAKVPAAAASKNAAAAGRKRSRS